jgi:diguanylate cyclase (GGDEF)-like protein/PAS domain S-box-containing protein
MSAFLLDVAKRIGSPLELPRTLERITAAVVELLDFEVAVLNLVTHDGDLETVAVAGPAQSLLGARDTRANWDALLSLGREVGALRFVDHTTPWPDGPSWVPDVAPSDDPNAWHPEDALFAPLISMDGELLGVLCVDCPTDGLQPDTHRCELLELFAVQAALALDHARLQTRLERNERMMRKTFEQAPVGMAVFGADRRLQQANPAYCAFLGRRIEDLIGMQVKDFTHPEDVQTTEQGSLKVRTGGAEVVRLEKRYLHADGRTIWGRLSLTALQTGYGETHVLAQLEDVTASREAAQELERRAATDSLTGLDNHAAVMTHLREALARRGKTAVLYCDVDNFKQVNDTLGHPAGDALLIEIARNLQAVLRPGDRAGRLGGDEFVLILHGVDAGEALEIAERSRKAARRVLKLDGRTVLTSMTVGVALGESGSSEASLLAAADRALLTAKREGRDRVVLG